MVIIKYDGIWYSYQPNKKKLNKAWQKLINKVFEEYYCRNGRRFIFSIDFSNTGGTTDYVTFYIKVSKWDLIKLFFPFKKYSLSILKYKYLIFEMK